VENRFFLDENHLKYQSSNNNSSGGGSFNVPYGESYFLFICSFQFTADYKPFNIRTVEMLLMFCGNLTTSIVKIFLVFTKVICFVFVSVFSQALTSCVIILSVIQKTNEVMDQHVLLESHNTFTSRESKQNLKFWGVLKSLSIFVGSLYFCI